MLKQKLVIDAHEPVMGGEATYTADPKTGAISVVGTALAKLLFVPITLPFKVSYAVDPKLFQSANVLKDTVLKFGTLKLKVLMVDHAKEWAIAEVTMPEHRLAGTVNLDLRRESVQIISFSGSAVVRGLGVKIVGRAI